MNGIIISRFRHEPYIITNAFIEMMDNESLMKTHSSNILLSGKIAHRKKAENKVAPVPETGTGVFL